MNVVLSVLPVAIAFVSVLLFSKSNRSMQAVYFVYSYLGIANTLYFFYAFMSYYTSCGYGRHACSPLKDMNANSISQLLTLDVLGAYFVSVFFYLREYKRFQPNAINPWQYISYTVIIGAPSALALYLSAQVLCLKPKWAREYPELLKQVQTQFIQFRAQLKAGYIDQESNHVYEVRSKFDGYVLLYLVVGVFYACLSMSNFWTIIGSVGSSHDSYNNYMNIYLTHQRFLLWVVLATRVLASTTGDAKVRDDGRNRHLTVAWKAFFSTFPFFSIAASIAFYCLEREWRSIGEESFNELSIDLHTWHLKSHVNAKTLKALSHSAQSEMDALHTSRSVAPAPRTRRSKA